MSGSPPSSSARKTLLAAGINHALHDGYTDLIFVLLPIWQAEFELSYAALALVRSLYVGALAAFQIPSTRLAQTFGARSILILGTLLSAAGYGIAGTSGSLVGLCVALSLSGVGSATQHPLASAVIARAYGRNARGPLGTYNFTGDLGKAIVPALAGFALIDFGWRHTLWIVGAVGMAVAVAMACLLPRDDAGQIQQAELSKGAVPDAAPPKTDSRSFWLLVAIGIFDNAARPAFLLYLPFLMIAKGAELPTVGVALSLVFVGGALGKAVCGWLGARFGVTSTVLLTETGTALAILALIGLPLIPSFFVLPLLGVMLNGTSSVLYGTVPELAPGGRVEQAFAVFYTCTLGSSAVAMPLFYGRLGDLVGPEGAAIAAAVTALAVVPLMLALAPRLSRIPAVSSLDHRRRS